jgi:hypothetical protein
MSPRWDLRREDSGVRFEGAGSGVGLASSSLYGAGNSAIGLSVDAPVQWATYIVMELCPYGSLRSALECKRLHKKGAPLLHEVSCLSGPDPLKGAQAG